MNNNQTPLEVFEQFPRPLQIALVQLARTAADTSADEKDDVEIYLRELAAAEVPEAVQKVARSTRAVIQAVKVDILAGRIRRGDLGGGAR